MKKIFVALMSLLLALTMVSALAENSMVQVIMNAGTSQAFTAETVPEEDVLAIVKAGLNATSAINQQPWYFVVITNPDVMAEVAGGGMGGGMPAVAEMPAGDGFEASNGASSGAPAMPAGDGFEASNGASSGASAAPAATGAAKAAMGDSPVAIVIYMNEATSSPNASFDCGLACQNMVIAAAAMGYGTKIVSSPTMTLNGANHDALCAKLGVDPAYQAVAVLLIGYEDAQLDAATGASVRNAVEEKVSFIK